MRGGSLLWGREFDMGEGVCSREGRLLWGEGVCVKYSMSGMVSSNT